MKFYIKNVFVGVHVILHVRLMHIDILQVAKCVQNNDVIAEGGGGGWL